MRLVCGCELCPAHEDGLTVATDADDWSEIDNEWSRLADALRIEFDLADLSDAQFYAAAARAPPDEIPAWLFAVESKRDAGLDGLIPLPERPPGCLASVW